MGAAKRHIAVSDQYDPHQLKNLIFVKSELEVMDIDRLTERVCRLASDFYSDGSKSIVSLINGAEIRGEFSFITASNIEKYLTKNPELIKQWSLWSENKRTSSGWYLLGNEVGFIPNGEVLHFANREIACAEFIRREIQDIIGRLK